MIIVKAIRHYARFRFLIPKSKLYRYKLSRMFRHFDFGVSYVQEIQHSAI